MLNQIKNEVAQFFATKKRRLQLEARDANVSASAPTAAQKPRIKFKTATAFDATARRDSPAAAFARKTAARKASSAPLSPMMAAALNEDNLLAAWQRVKENDGTSGFDGQTIAAFSHNVLGRLQQLKGEVEHGQYAPQMLTEIDIAQPNRRMRTPCVPAVRDRILQTAVALILSDRLDPEFADISYAYRPKRCSAQAIARVTALREAGYIYVLDADIEGYFDNINHAQLLAVLSSHINDAPLCRLVHTWVTGLVAGKAGQRMLVRGVPQGSPLSPLLSNLYLDSFDDALAKHRLRHVRFADDFVVCCRTAQDASDARLIVIEQLKMLKLRLHPQKTRLTSFDEGFNFLGVRFFGSLVEAIDPDAAKWVTPHASQIQHARQQQHPVDVDRNDARSGLIHESAQINMPFSHVADEPAPHRIVLALSDDEAEQSDFGPDESAAVRLSTTPHHKTAALLQTLYVSEPGARLSKENERLIVSKDKTILASVPLGQLDQIAVLSNAMISTALLHHCLQNRVQIAFSDQRHNEVITLDRGSLPDLQLLIAQQQMAENRGLKMMLARQFVEGKIHNQRLILRRFTRHTDRERVEAHIRQITELQTKLASVADLAQIRGLEGAAAKAYFAGLKILLPVEINFAGRVRRPPKDPTNVLLSFGYAVLTHNMQTLLRMAGLNAHIGSLHAAGAGSLALACDMIEEFRAPVVDAVALTLLRSGAITNLSFEWDANNELPCKLKPDARRLFIKSLEEKLESKFIHPLMRQPLDLRRGMQYQVQQYIKVVTREEKNYQPLKLK